MAWSVGEFRIFLASNAKFKPPKVDLEKSNWKSNYESLTKILLAKIELGQVRTFYKHETRNVHQAN